MTWSWWSFGWGYAVGFLTFWVWALCAINSKRHR